MKRLFLVTSILFCICIVCSPFVFAAEPTFALHDASLLSNTATVTVSAPESCTVTAALYTVDGKLQAVGAVAVSASPERQSLDVVLAGHTTNYETLKVFLQDSDTSAPMCGCLTKSALELQIDALNLPRSWKEELHHASKLGLPMDKLGQETISGSEWAALLDWLVAYADESKLTNWQARFPALRTHEEALTRFDAMGALYLAAQTLENNWASFKSDPMSVMGILQFPWDHYYFTYDLVVGIDGQHFAIPGTDELQYLDGACLNFNFSRPSGFSGEYPFSYDVTNNTIHEFVPPTYAECLLAVVRYIASEQPELIGIIDPTRPDNQLLTQALIDRSNNNPSVTAENHPQWNGFVLGWDPDVYYSATPDNIRHIANWGFNSLRVMIDYRNLFDAEDVTKSNPAGLRYLDLLISTAIENDLHLNLCLCKIPGRCAIVDPDTYTSTGEFDLFINEAQQDRTDHIWSVLAARYRDVSSANLSITPFWEALNKNLSTGLPYEDYTPEDVGAYLVRVVDVIRKEDPDRLIIYEPTANAPYVWPNEEVPPIQAAVQNIDNLMVSFNSGEAPYNYAAMTATEGEHIDNNNHSIPLPSYPTYYYSANPNINRYAPMTLDGFLPAGTRIDLYLDTSGSGTITVTADEHTLFNELVLDETYNVSYSLSRYYPYAASDKCISITLPQDTNLLTISTESWFTWSGMDVTLPDAYAIDQWWYITPYDVFLGLEETDGIVQRHTSRIIISPRGEADSRKITIHKNVSYTTDTIHEESSAETIRQFCENVKKLDGNCILRTEPEFVGVVWEDWAEYLNDIYTAFTAYGFSWWSNEFWAITNEYPQTKIFTGNTITEYDGFTHFNRDLLQLLQKYTNPVNQIN